MKRLRHDFAIGPQRHSDLFERPARVYYCVRCKFTFLVCGSKVAVLNEDEVPITGEDSLRGFNTFGEGPCPVLEAFVSAMTARAEALRPPLRSKGDGPVGVAPVPLSTCLPGRPGCGLHCVCLPESEKTLLSGSRSLGASESSTNLSTIWIISPCSACSP
jgi:hypothetical protein